MSENIIWGELPPTDFYEAQRDYPHVDTLIGDCLADNWPGGDALAAGKEARGEIVCNHIGLQGPPGRVHGGRQVVLRVFTILDRIPTHTLATAFPCALMMRFRKSMPVGQTFPFRARYRRDASGRWGLATRFLDTERLDSYAWSLPQKFAFMPRAALDEWRIKYQEAKESVDRESANLSDAFRARLGSYRGVGDMRWMRIDGTSPDAKSEYNLHRYVTPKGFSLAFLTEMLDVIGGSQRTREMGTPAFTTRFALYLATRHIPTNEPVLFVTDVSKRRPTPFPQSQPVDVDGVMLGTETSEVLCVNDSWTCIYGYGWMDTHPADMSKFPAALRGTHPFLKSE